MTSLTPNSSNQSALKLKTSHHQWAAVLTIILIIWCVIWEIWGAPIRLGGSWLAVKGLVLLPLVWGMYQQRKRSFQIMSMLILLFLLEASTRVFTDPNPISRWFAAVEAVIAAAIFYLANVMAYRLKYAEAARLATLSNTPAPTKKPRPSRQQSMKIYAWTTAIIFFVFWVLYQMQAK